MNILSTLQSSRAQNIADQLAHTLKPTPLRRSSHLPDVYWKLESLQRSGSFKMRPALSGLLSNLTEARERGVVCSSSGNFAIAVAEACRDFGVSATIVMMSDASPQKISATKDRGAQVVLCDPTFEARMATTRQLIDDQGAVELHPFDSIETILGNATLARELASQFGVKALRVVVPSSGGGLAAGIAWQLAEWSDQSEIVIAQPEQGGALVRSLRSQERLTHPTGATIADGLRAERPGQIPIEILLCLKRVGRLSIKTHLIPESEIQEAWQDLATKDDIFVEPSSAIALAAIRRERESTDWNQRLTVGVLTGANGALLTP